MAKKNMMTWMLKSLGVSNVEDSENDHVIRDYRSISDKEVSTLFKDIYVPNTGRQFGGGFDTQNIPSMIEPITRDLLDRRTDNDKLLTLAKEVTQAASIAVPSIISPNDFSKNNFSIVIEGGNESSETKTKIIDILKQHFENELDIHVKISEWIEEALFTIGCKAIILLPTTFMADLKRDVTSSEMLLTNISSLSSKIDASTESLRIDLKQKNKAYLSDDDIVDNIFNTKLFDEYLDSSSLKERDKQSLAIRKAFKSSLDDIFKEFNNKKVLSFTDDPRVFISKHIENTSAVEALDNKILGKLKDNFTVSYRDQKDGIAGAAGASVNNITGFKYAPYIDLSKYILNNKIGSYPAMIELPAESVIPIIVEGSPSVHIGYFVVINENGLPISASNDTYSDMVSSTYGSQRINKLFNSFYGNSQLSMHQKLAIDAKFEILNSIYDSYLQNILKSKLTDIGLKNHRIELTNSISKVMFARLLKSTETRVVFVPKKLMNYLAYKYNTDGTGRSKIEDIKFPLSLKMTFIIVRLISLIESAINRRTLNISLDDTSGNPLELLRMIKKDVLSNKLYDISYDPSTIIKTVQEKGLTIIPDKIPGVESFALTENQNNVEYPRPDDAILEEINNMYMLSLDVPPSALNRLGEEEFSRSVAANNIFFSNKIRANQTITCNFMTDFIQSYVNFSKSLEDMIKEVLNNDAAGEDVKTPSKTVNDKIPTKTIEADTDKLKDPVEGKLSIDERYRTLIENIKFTLPAPNLVHDRAGFEELNEYITIITTLLENLYPDDSVIDPEVAGVLKVLRSTLRRSILQDHIKNNSMLSDINFDALTDIDVTSSVDVTQKMMNLKKALDQAVKVFSNTPTEGDATDVWAS